VPWGTHFGAFYETQNDLFEIVVPYFQAGLNASEACMWVACNFSKEEVATALRASIPRIDDHLASGALELVSQETWYGTSCSFESERLVAQFKEKLRCALDRGFVGLRVHGNEAWLAQKDWKAFEAYECSLHKAVVDRTLILCTYPLAKMSASQVFDVAKSHQFTITRRNGNWEILETTESVGAKSALEALNQHLEMLVEKRSAELRDTMRRLDHAQKMEALGRLAGGVAHDFNNLLTAIYGYAELAAGEVRQNSRAYDHVREIQRATDRGESVTRQLLTFSRRDVREPEVIEISELLRRTEPLLRILVREDVHLDLRPCQGRLSIFIDPARFEQVLVNLVANARDATPSGGNILISCDEVGADSVGPSLSEFVESGRYVRIQVTDNGCGMSADTLEKAFDPFFTTKPPGAGTGLGLSSVFGIVRHANGYVWIDSDHSTGTTVTVIFPVAERNLKKRARTRKPRDTTKLAGVNVLIVEDDAMIRGFAEEVLNKNGARGIIADSPSSAITHLKDSGSQIDVLVTDVVMPGMSGLELAAVAIKERPQLPVVLMSGYTADSDLLENVPTGWAVLEKPFRPEELIRAIAKVIDAADAPKSRAGKSRAQRRTSLERP
jgi:signal transduction histidine kinase/FixJ family two-component response regulator